MIRPKEPIPLDEEEEGKRPDYATIGRMGGLKGGPARAQRLTPEKRKEIARKGGLARHGLQDPPDET